MSTQLDIRKVLSLPATFDPNTLYILKDPNDVDHMIFYLTSNDGLSVRRLPTLQDMEDLISSNPYGVSSQTNMYVVSNLSERDSLSVSIPSLSWVLDTQGDATANGYAAPYIYVPAGSDGKSGNWYNLYNANYLTDVSWNEISGAPQASVSDIDSMVNWWNNYYSFS